MRNEKENLARNTGILIEWNQSHNDNVGKSIKSMLYKKRSLSKRVNIDNMIGEINMIIVMSYNK